MKREEMVQKMTEFWLGMLPNGTFYDDLVQMEVTEKMSMLLHFLEQEGMRPPVKKRCPVLLTENHVWELE